MKIILRKDFETLGYAGDIKEVKDGYARNYLIPQGIAYIANQSNLKTFEEVKRQQSRKTLKEVEDAKKFASKIEKEVITELIEGYERELPTDELSETEEEEQEIDEQLEDVIEARPI